jgi:hypothetical protein
MFRPALLVLTSLVLLAVPGTAAAQSGDATVTIVTASPTRPWTSTPTATGCSTTSSPRR